MTTTTTTKARHITRIESTTRTLEGYNAMLEIARRFMMEDEIVRIERNIVEFENEMEYVIEAAILDGISPEDLD